MEPIPRAVAATRTTGTVSAQAQVEARRLGRHYLGPEQRSAVRSELDRPA